MKKECTSHRHGPRHGVGGVEAASLEVTSSPAPRPLYSVGRSEGERFPPVKMIVLGLVCMVQVLTLSCWRVKPSLLSPPSQGSSSVAVGDSLPPTRRRPWLVTADVWRYAESWNYEAFVVVQCPMLGRPAAGTDILFFRVCCICMFVHRMKNVL